MTVNVLKFEDFYFSVLNKILVFRAGIHKMFVILMAEFTKCLSFQGWNSLIV